MPFFKWYPAEAEADAEYRSMTLEERGLFHMCLNLAWVNGGLPSDLGDLARMLRVNRNKLGKLWRGRVGVKFKQVGGILQNTRQELQRQQVGYKSLKASESAKARYERSATPSENAGEIQIQIQSKKQIQIQTQSDDAREFAEKFPDQSDQNSTVREYLSLVEPHEKAAVLACLERYKGSEQVARGVMQTGWRWLRNQKENGWNGKWPPLKKGPQRLTEAEEIAQLERWKAEDEEQERAYGGR